MSEPTIHPARERVKLAPDAPALTIGLPVRKRSPVEFWISMLQLLPPLNVRLSYIVQKGADAPGGKLPAEARNAILNTALTSNIPYVLFLDDDVLFPDMMLYRLWVNMQKHPEAACITGIYPTKVEPCEPLIYADDANGAYWDWALGELVPIHSAGAGCMLINMDYVKRLEPPWFNDVVVDGPTDSVGLVKRHTWGQDRYFHNRLRDEAGGVIYADTGLLCAHWDTDQQRAYILPPDSPCFQKNIKGECFVPYINGDNALEWRRYLPQTGPDPDFLGYLDWRSKMSAALPQERMALVGDPA